MGNWIVSPEEQANNNKQWESSFKGDVYKDIAMAREKTELEIQQINAKVVQGVLSRGLADDDIEKVKARQLKYEEKMLELIKH